MKRNLLINLILIFVTTSIFAQEKTEEKEKNAVSTSTTVVVNEKLIAKYEKFMENGSYVSLWETVKDYNFKEMNGYYNTYKNYEFEEGTTYAEIKMKYEKDKESTNLAEESEPLKKENTKDFLTKIQ